MIGLALLGVQAALPQHVPHHVDDLLPHFHGGPAHFLQRPVHDGLGIVKKYIRLRLLILLVACVIITPVVTHFVVAHVIDNVTHLLFLGVVLAVIYDCSGGSSGSGSRSTNHLVLRELCFLWLVVMCD